MNKFFNYLDKRPLLMCMFGMLMCSIGMALVALLTPSPICLYDHQVEVIQETVPVVIKEVWRGKYTSYEGIDLKYNQKFGAFTFHGNRVIRKPTDEATRVTYKQGPGIITRVFNLKTAADEVIYLY